MPQSSTHIGRWCHVCRLVNGCYRFKHWLLQTEIGHQLHIWWPEYRSLIISLCNDKNLSCCVVSQGTAMGSWSTIHLCTFSRVACWCRANHFPSTASWHSNSVHNTRNTARPISLCWCCGFLQQSRQGAANEIVYIDEVETTSVHWLFAV